MAEIQLDTYDEKDTYDDLIVLGCYITQKTRDDHCVFLVFRLLFYWDDRILLSAAVLVLSGARRA